MPLCLATVVDRDELLLTIAAARLCGDRSNRCYGLAAAVEFIHTATLLHDDVVDSSDLRRGKRTANIIWGNPASVLVGDFLFSRSFQLMVADGSLDVLKTLSEASAVIASGEVQQLMVSHDLHVVMASTQRVICLNHHICCEGTPQHVGGNAALLGDEIIQFQTAELLAPFSYRLSNLLRGRLGTEYRMGSHATHERFVLLGEGLFTANVGTGFIGLGKKYKPVSVGSTLTATEAVDFNYGAQCLKPYAPVHISGSRDGGACAGCPSRATSGVAGSRNSSNGSYPGLRWMSTVRANFGACASSNHQ